MTFKLSSFVIFFGTRASKLRLSETIEMSIMKASTASETGFWMDGGAVITNGISGAGAAKLVPETTRRMEVYFRAEYIFE